MKKINNLFKKDIKINFNFFSFFLKTSFFFKNSYIKKNIKNNLKNNLLLFPVFSLKKYIFYEFNYFKTFLAKNKLTYFFDNNKKNFCVNIFNYFSKKTNYNQLLIELEENLNQTAPIKNLKNNYNLNYNFNYNFNFNLHIFNILEIYKIIYIIILNKFF